MILSLIAYTSQVWLLKNNFSWSDLGYKEAYLLVAKENLGAIALYLRSNFEPVLEDAEEEAQWLVTLESLRGQLKGVFQSLVFALPLNERTHRWQSGRSGVGCFHGAPIACW